MFPGKGPLMGEALQAFAEQWSALDDSQWPAALAIKQQFIERWQTLINAPAGTLTTADNVTTALYTFIGALPVHHLQGKRFLVAADCFPSLHFLLAGMAERRGFTLDTVPLRSGETWVRDEDLVSRWDESVGVALLTQVTSTASHRCDLDLLVGHGRRMGSIVGVDITQGVGILPYDARSPEVDFTVSTSLKWLCGSPGAGILHVRKPILEECRPELRGWFSQENPFSWDLDAFTYAADARRFDHGTPSILACAGSLPALAWHAEQDQKAMLTHNRALTDRILSEAARLGLAVVSPLDENRRGGSVMLRLPEHATPAKIVSSLRAADIYTDCRGSTLRLSAGCVTTMQGVERLLQNLESLVRTA